MRRVKQRSIETPLDFKESCSHSIPEQQQGPDSPGLSMSDNIESDFSSSSEEEEDVAADDNGDTVHSRGTPINFERSCSPSRSDFSSSSEEEEDVAADNNGDLVPVESQLSPSIQTDGSHDHTEDVKDKFSFLKKCSSLKKKLKNPLRKLLLKIRAKRRRRDG